MDGTAVIVIIVTAILAPTMATVLAAMVQSYFKRQDWARQDLVALQAKHDTAAVTGLLDVVNKKADVIHTLVNSDMTRALQGQLTAMEAQKVLLEEGTQSDKRIAAVMALDQQIAELKTTLETRAKQAIIAEGQTKVAEEAEAELNGKNESVS